MNKAAEGGSVGIIMWWILCKPTFCDLSRGQWQQGLHTMFNGNFYIRQYCNSNKFYAEHRPNVGTVPFKQSWVCMLLLPPPHIPRP